MDERLQPVDRADRIITLDVIRGFALLGIFLVNMGLFTSPEIFMTAGDVTLFDDPLSQIASWFITIFATGKFFTTFSFLFGLGFFLFMDRVAAKGLSVPRVYSRRLLFLFVVGLIHGVIFWSGDILLPYAIAGFFLLLFRKKTVESIRKWAIGLFSSVLIILGFMTYLNDVVENVFDPEGTISGYYVELVNTAIDVYQHGSFMEILSFRMAEEVPLIMMNLLFTVPMVLSIFLFGLYVGKKGVLTDIQAFLPWIRGIWKKSFVYGFILTALHVILLAEIFVVPAYFHGAVVEVIGLVSGLIISFFYISSITLLCQQKEWLARLHVLAPVGQMALTNYLLQTFLSILIFNGYGLGFYGNVNPAAGILITVGIFVIQIFLSKLWLSKYRFGPAERVWRSFTYKGIKS
ncbi:DUF418 domain-containing protein [Evansella tamaricis]|uniref:DUF418 domain-containing protein n=1 Tax=Evansella tamaricis TaxID=2069301 RepID=A0ABS6JGD8_9BACI|nr:DUF418 domain-containing protein [Evansella tamaricis]MBU9712686.1 DUF418 domain-containing protein [Evansella tamaricis]